jgi:putative DNA primase/helicase
MNGTMTTATSANHNRERGWSPIRLKEKIPAEMQSYRAWVVWRYIVRDGKQTKMLYDPLTGFSASSRDSRTWRSFDEAVAAYDNGGYDGIGFVLSSGDPYTGFDFDKCRDPESGKLTEWAIRMIKGLGGYAEVSPSGRGVHVIVRGDLPEGMRKKVSRDEGGAIEAYDAKRFLTVTGESL